MKRIQSVIAASHYNTCHIYCNSLSNGSSTLPPRRRLGIALCISQEALYADIGQGMLKHSHEYAIRQGGNGSTAFGGSDDVPGVSQASGYDLSGQAVTVDYLHGVAHDLHPVVAGII